MPWLFDSISVFLVLIISVIRMFVIIINIILV
jgi:hypothetical protein